MKGKIGRCCIHCDDGENPYPQHCSCLCHEHAKCQSDQKRSDP